MDIQPFHIHVPESDLSDLLDRLVLTRWPDEIEGAEWDYGSNLAYTKELVEYWSLNGARRRRPSTACPTFARRSTTD